MKNKIYNSKNAPKKTQGIKNEGAAFSRTEITMGDKKFKIENSNEIKNLQNKIKNMEIDNQSMKSKINSLSQELQKLRYDMKTILQELRSTRYKGNNGNDTGFYQ